MKKITLIPLALFITIAFISKGNIMDPDVSPEGTTAFCSSTGNNSFLYEVSGTGGGDTDPDSWEILIDGNWEKVSDENNNPDNDFSFTVEFTGDDADGMKVSNFAFDMGTEMSFTFRYKKSGMDISNEVILNVTLSPVTAVATATSNIVCVGDDIELSVTPDDMTYNWSGPDVDDETTQTQTILADNDLIGDNEYIVTVTDGDGCIDVDTVNVLVGAIPAQPGVEDQEECATDPLVPLTAMATVPDDHTAVWRGTNDYDAPPVADPILDVIGQIQYFAFSVEDATGCHSSPGIAVVLTILDTLSAPTGSDQIVCETDPLPNLTADADPPAGAPDGTTVVWYADAVGGDPIPTPTLNEIGEETYYAACVNDPSEYCESNRIPITLAIIAAPSVPSGEDQTECEENPIQTLIAEVDDPGPGINIVWYTVPTGGTPFPGVPSLNTVDEITYYAEAVSTTGSCPSTSRKAITLEILAAPDAPTGEDQAECEENPIQTLTADADPPPGSTVIWYDMPVGGTPISGDPTWDMVGSKTYYASSRSNSNQCESTSRTAITLTIEAAPDAPEASDITECEEDPIQTLTADATPPSGSSVIWYDQAIGGSVVPNPILDMVGTETYYAASSTVGASCESLTRTEVTLTIHPAPSINDLDQECSNDLESVSISFSTENTNTVSADAGDVNDNGGGNWTIDNVDPNVTLTITVTTDQDCEEVLELDVIDCDCSPATTPEVPTASETVFHSCIGENNPTFTADVPTGVTVDWYDQPIGGSIVAGGDGTLSYTAPDSDIGEHIYYAEARDEDSDCVSANRLLFSLTIHDLPDVTAQNDGPYCVGQDITLEAMPMGLVSYTWSGPASFDEEGRVVIRPNASIDMNGNYTVVGVDEFGCVNDAQTNVLVNDNPDATATADDNIICDGDEIVLHAFPNGFSYEWSGNGITPENMNLQDPVISSGYDVGQQNIYSVTVTSGSSCSDEATIVIEVNPRPDALDAENAVYCEGDIAEPLGPTGANILWYQNPTGGVGSNNPPTPTTTSAGDQLFYFTVVSSGCESERTETTVRIGSLPQTAITLTEDSGNASDDNEICEGDMVTLTASGADEYVWSTGPVSEMISFNALKMTHDNISVIGTNNVNLGSLSKACMVTADINLQIFSVPEALYAQTGVPEVNNFVFYNSASNEGDGVINEYKWDFTTPGLTDPDPANAVTTDPDQITVQYQEDGVYDVCLMITDVNGCVDMTCGTANIVEPGSCRAEIEYTGPKPCVGSEISITESSIPSLGGANLISWQYDFGVGATPAILDLDTDHSSVKVSYSTAGTKFVTLTIMDSEGCENTTNISFDVVLGPEVSTMVTDTEICKGEDGEVVINFPDDPGGVFFIKGSIKSSGDSTIFEGNYSNGTPYTFTVNEDVTFTITEITDLTSECTLNGEFGIQSFTVLDLPEITVVENELLICVLELDSLSANGGIDYSWSPETGLISPDMGTTHIQLSGAGTQIYTVTGSDENGCKNTAEVSVETLAQPESAIVVDLDQDCGERCQTLLEVTNAGGNLTEWEIADPGSFSSEVVGDDNNVFLIDWANSDSPGNSLQINVRLTNGAGCASESIQVLDIGDTSASCPEMEIRECDNRIIGDSLKSGMCITWGTINKETGEIIRGLSDNVFYSPPNYLENKSKFYYFSEIFPCTDPTCRTMTIFRESEDNKIDCYVEEFFTLYPNPNDGKFNILLSSNLAGIHEILIFDAVGRKISTTNVMKSENELLHEINLKNQATGVFYVIVKDPFGNLQNKKFILID